MLKRTISLLLALCLVAGAANLTASAKSSSIEGIVVRTDGNYTIAEMAIIKKAREEMHSSIKTQLLAQDAIDQYELFVSIFDAEFDNTYFPTATRSTVPSTITASNGGYIKAFDNQIEIISQYLTAEQAEDLYVKTHTYGLTDACAAIILMVYGVAWTGAGVMTSLASIVGSLMDTWMWSNISVGDDPALIVTSYDKLDQKTTTVISKWNNYPIMTNGYNHIGNVSYGRY